MGKSTVYILGAGCSVKYGYPLAAQFVDVLDAFGKTLGERAEKIRRCVEETVGLMRKVHVQTLDDLTARIHNGVFDGSFHVSPKAVGKRLQRTRDAKIATNALFLSKESAARETGLKSYHDFVLKLFPGSGDWSRRIRSAQSHVLTFNYDRLFEMAVLDRFGIDDQYLLYGSKVLNSGLNDVTGSQIEFEPSRFCFLKLHGSAGVRVWEDEWGQQYNPFIDGRRPGGEVDISDARFFGESEGSARRPRPPQPLIVFPHEKQHLQSDQSAKFPFRDYLKKVWDQAALVIAEAEERRIRTR